MRSYPEVGGGKMLRALTRAAAGGGVQVALATTTKPCRTPPLVSVPSPSPSSSSSSSCSASLSIAAALSDAMAGRRNLSSSFLLEGEGSESEVEDEEGGGVWYTERCLFGTAPSDEEVAEAVSALQQIFVPFRFTQAAEDFSSSILVEDAVNKTSTSTETMDSKSQGDWLEPPIHVHKSNTVQSEGHDKLMDAFHSLQINPSIQRMVVSLSSDKAIWDAVMKNEAVKELRESFYADDNSEAPNHGGGPDIARILNRVIRNTRAKIMEFVDKIVKLVNELFHPEEKRKMNDFEDTVRSSFTLSVVVFIVVIMFRVHRS